MAGDGLIKIVVNISADHRVERLRHGVWTSKPFDIFSFSIVPPDEEFRFSVKGQADILQIFLPQAALGAEPGTAAAPTIRPRFQAHDPGIERYALRLMHAVQRRCSVDDLHLAELIAGLGDLLAHDFRRQSEPVSGGIPPHRLRRVLENSRRDRRIRRREP